MSKRLSSFSLILFLFVSMMSFQARATLALDVPEDQPKANLSRTAETNTLEVQLSKNLFVTKYKTVMENHAHQCDHHPGHDPQTCTETYEEQERYCHLVEYWVDEPYYDYETYWDWEYYWAYERYQEYVCRVENGHRHCHYENRTRPVYRKRWVQKTRRVVRYRKVKKEKCDWRWRTVTKTRPRMFTDAHPHQVPYQAYDRTVERHVTVKFPEEAKLYSGEVENVTLAFDGEGVSLNTDSKYYIYQEHQREQNRNDLVITLGLKPLDAELYGKSSIQKLKLTGEYEKAKLSFVDTKPFYRVDTSYDLEIIDEDGAVIVKSVLDQDMATEPLRTFNLSLVPGEGRLGRQVTEFLKGYVDYTIRLHVKRVSVLFPKGKLEFTLEAKRKGELDQSLYGRNSITGVELYRKGGNTYLKIADNAAGHEKVDVRYSFKMTRAVFLGIGTHVVGRAHWNSDGTKDMVYLLQRGASNPIAAGLREKMSKKTKYYIRLRVWRTSPLLEGGQAYFEINKKIKLR